METIAFVTSNALKLQDVKAILEDNVAFKFIHYDIALPELQASPDEISMNKCVTAATILQGPVVVEDTSLSCPSLNGLPGPYIKTFLAHIGLEGVARLLVSFPDKTAEARSTFAYTAGPNQPVKLFTGSMHGKIIMPHATNGVAGMHWGYIFQPDGHAVCYASLDKTKKNKISHRYKALIQLKDYLINNNVKK
ncbi:non-canonical purine NTP pyrophosphatase [Candidatus Cardinium hertigii]|uniref:DITP/XTP pyrophosphatase n=1 Tax=Candidatus Cardinium hertigii TaxID=247481 RepID=A0A2Z3L7K5_9BACT|nr:non-canonical purine NTP pyrophosphatase [Candidatus Cardinium hertigii]AWN81429.1 dITP/XTP pyrophosphatase [Candidatus Cardinium hertigii]